MNDHQELDCRRGKGMENLSREAAIAELTRIATVIRSRRHCHMVSVGIVRPLESLLEQLNGGDDQQLLGDAKKKITAYSNLEKWPPCDVVCLADQDQTTK